MPLYVEIDEYKGKKPLANCSHRRGMLIFNTRALIIQRLYISAYIISQIAKRSCVRVNHYLWDDAHFFHRKVCMDRSCFTITVKLSEFQKVIVKRYFVKWGKQACQLWHAFWIRYMAYQIIQISQNILIMLFRSAVSGGTVECIPIKKICLQAVFHFLGFQGFGFINVQSPVILPV